MNILITGSEGTIGKKLQLELESRGHIVFGIDLKHSLKPNISRCDIAEFRQVLDAFDRLSNAGQRIDIVYHLAAEFGRLNGEHYYEQVWKSNVIGTRNILEAQRIYGFKLIFGSSSEIYGELKTDFITEDMRYGRLTNDYAISKLVNEMQILNFREKYNNQVMTLRFFNSYGPGEYYNEYRSVCCLFCYRILHDMPITVYKDYHRVFMYMDDFIPTLANASKNFIDGEIINIGGDEYRPVQDLAHIVVATIGASDHLVQYKEIDHHNVTNKRPSIAKAKSILNHNPTIMLEEGIYKTVEWMKEVYKNGKH